MSRGWDMPIRVLAVVLACSLGAGATARAATPGSPDRGFGSGGVITLGADSQLFGVAVQSNGSVVAAGQSGGSTLVERFTAAGQPDPAFGSGGQAGGPSGFARAAAIQSDGKVVVAGGGPGMYVERLNANGTPDTGFGAGGVAVAGALGASAIGYAVAVQPDGKVVVAGSVNPNDTRIALARFSTNGTIDASFGSGGAEILDLGLPYAVAQGVAVQPDGKIVLAGHEQGSTNYAFFNGLVARLNSNGGLDGSFAGSGVYTFHQAGSGFTGANAVALQNDGRIVVAGAATEANPYALFLRLTADGSPDPSFGSAGVAQLTAGTATSAPVGANGVGIAGGGRIVGGGAVQLNGTDYRPGLWALTATGGADTEGAFANQGLVDDQTSAEGCALAIAPDGSLVTVGDSVSPTRSQAVAPCMPNSSSTAFVARYAGFGPPPPSAQPGAAPTVSTSGASGISQVAATLSGHVNPHGLATSFHFDYGLTSTYGSSTAPGPAGAGHQVTSVSVRLTGLSPDTRYHYRVAASNSAGAGTSADATFTTPPTTAPHVGSASAERITEVSARIRATIDPGGLPTSYHVDYGRTAAHGSHTATAQLPAGASPGDVSAVVRRLRAATTYHYRLVASNADGTTYGRDRTFKTLPRLRASLRGVAGAYKLASILEAGIAFHVGCSHACSVKATLTISARDARHLKLGRHGLTIAGGSASLKHGGVAKLVVRVRKAFQPGLGHAATFGAMLHVVFSPSGGGRADRLSRALTLRR